MNIFLCTLGLGAGAIGAVCVTRWEVRRRRRDAHITFGGRRGVFVQFDNGVQTPAFYHELERVTA